MRILKINKNIKCDTVFCCNFAEYELEFGSYKGNVFLCEECFKEMQSMFKKFKNKNEESVEKN